MTSCTHLPPSGQPVIIIMCCAVVVVVVVVVVVLLWAGIPMKYTNYANNSSRYSDHWGKPERAPCSVEYSKFLLWVDDDDDDDDDDVRA